MTNAAVVRRSAPGPLRCPGAERSVHGRRPAGKVGRTVGRVGMHERESLTCLVARAREGDQRAWDEVVERFAGLLWAIARSHRLDSQAAADCVQATWLRLVESLDRIDQPEALPGWLLTTARREALRIINSQGRVLLDRDEEPRDRPDDQADDLDAHLLTSERDTALWRTFGRLGERCRRLLRILMADDAPPYAVVATELGMPVGSIGPTRARCLSRLRELLGESGYEFRAGATRGQA